MLLALHVPVKRRNIVLVKNIEERLGAVVRSLRLAAGMTQEQLAQAVTEKGWTARQNTIAKLENGMRPTTILELGLIAAAFDMSVHDLGALIWPPKVEDEDESARFALKESLAMKRVQLKTARSELATLDLEAQQLKHTAAELELSIKELEDQLGQHSEEA